MDLSKMYKSYIAEEDSLIDWRREASEEAKTKRFCPNCFQLVTLQLREHKYYQNFYACPNCGETLFSKGTFRLGSSSGYSRNWYRMRRLEG
ncbi:MAG: hypothetical protein FK734_12495 [Asgard group archaeon]|nr:hypothetical protein [Asgard group archaeon]